MPKPEKNGQEDKNKVPVAKNETDTVKTEVKPPEWAVNVFSEFGFFVAQHQKQECPGTAADF